MIMQKGEFRTFQSVLERNVHMNTLPILRLNRLTVVIDERNIKSRCVNNFSAFQIYILSVSECRCLGQIADTQSDVFRENTFINPRTDYSSL